MSDIMMIINLMLAIAIVVGIVAIIMQTPFE